ncbi:hypothetical protein Bca101_079285 [Brassica carinata]
MTTTSAQQVSTVASVWIKSMLWNTYKSLILYSLISAEFPTYKINLNQSQRTSSLAGGLRAPFPDLLFESLPPSTFFDSIRQQVELWSPFPDQPWKPCTQPYKAPLRMEYYATGIRATRIKTAPTHASADWYVENLLPVVTLRFVAKYRQVIWQGRVLNSQLTDEELRNKDEEIGLLLSALASAEELAEVEGKASVMAAVDYYVSMKSDIFISASPGNMHNALLAHGAYLNLMTVNPNTILLGQVLVNRSIGWSEFEGAVLKGHKNSQGQLRLRKSIYTYPAPDCMCKVA